MTQRVQVAGHDRRTCRGGFGNIEWARATGSAALPFCPGNERAAPLRTGVDKTKAGSINNEDQHYYLSKYPTFNLLFPLPHDRH